jgi:hypothetical protein
MRRNGVPHDVLVVERNGDQRFLEREPLNL